MKKSSVIIIALALLSGVVFVLTQRVSRDKEGFINTKKDTQSVVPPKEKIGTITELGDGWSRYSNKERGIEFEYPSETLNFFLKVGHRR